MDGEDFDIFDWPKNALGKKIVELEKSLHCPICGGLFENPHSLNCGHSFCSLCIRRHLDKTLNSVTSDQCPVCREKGAEVFQLKANSLLATIAQAYKLLRNDVLSVVREADDEARITGITKSVDESSNKKRKATGDSLPVTRRIPHFSFHGKSKKYVKDAIEKLCAQSRVKPTLEGEQDDLERFYRELVHVNNAQVGSLSAMSFDEVVREVNNKEAVRRREAKKTSKASKEIEKMKNGQSSEFDKNFLTLVQKVREEKKRKLDVPGSPIAKDSKSHKSTTPQKKRSQVADDAEVLGEYRWGPWRVVMSEKLGRPFFFNSKTNVGQWAIPPELAIDENQLDARVTETEISNSSNSSSSICSAVNIASTSNAKLRQAIEPLDIIGVQHQKGVEKSTSPSLNPNPNKEKGRRGKHSKGASLPLPLPLPTTTTSPDVHQKKKQRQGRTQTNADHNNIPEEDHHSSVFDHSTIPSQVDGHAAAAAAYAADSSHVAIYRVDDSATKKAALAALQRAAMESEPEPEPEDPDIEPEDPDISQFEYTNMSGHYVPFTQPAVSAAADVDANATQLDEEAKNINDDEEFVDIDDDSQGGDGASASFFTQTQSDQAQGSRSSGSGSEQWSCAVCTYINGAMEFSCEMCGTASGMRRSSRSGNDHGFMTQMQTQTQSRPPADAFSMMKSSSSSDSQRSGSKGSSSNNNSRTSTGGGKYGRHNNGR